VPRHAQPPKGSLHGSGRAVTAEDLSFRIQPILYGTALPAPPLNIELISPHCDLYLLISEIRFPLRCGSLVGIACLESRLNRGLCALVSFLANRSWIHADSPPSLFRSQIGRIGSAMTESSYNHMVLPPWLYDARKVNRVDSWCFRDNFDDSLSTQTVDDKKNLIPREIRTLEDNFIERAVRGSYDDFENPLGLHIENCHTSSSLLQTSQ
jgi:hypothetical protein